MPSSNETDLSIEKAILIACIMLGIKVNVGELIFREFRIRANQKETSLLFPCLIHALCEAREVPPLPKHDRIETAVHDSDITRINDALDKVIEGPLEHSITPLPASATSATSSVPDTSSAPATSTSTPRPATATPLVLLPALSKLGLLAQHANAKVDKLTKELSSLFR